MVYLLHSLETIVKKGFVSKLIRKNSFFSCFFYYFLYIHAWFGWRESCRRTAAHKNDLVTTLHSSITRRRTPPLFLLTNANNEITVVYAVVSFPSSFFPLVILFFSEFGSGFCADFSPCLSQFSLQPPGFFCWNWSALYIFFPLVEKTDCFSCEYAWISSSGFYPLWRLFVNGTKERRKMERKDTRIHIKNEGRRAGVS